MSSTPPVVGAAVAARLVGVREAELLVGVGDADALGVESPQAARARLTTAARASEPASSRVPPRREFWGVIAGVLSGFEFMAPPSNRGLAVGLGGACNASQVRCKRPSQAVRSETTTRQTPAR